MWPSIQVKTTSARYTYVHINTQNFNTIAKIMIANPTDHSLSTKGQHMDASEWHHKHPVPSSGRHVAEINVQTTCLSSLNPGGGAKAESRCGPEQRLFKKYFHMAATK